MHSVLVEESLIGWKEYELEVMRDRADNFVVVCSIENLDPMGVHTGDSITVAPAQTLTDKEYQRLRDQARLVMRAVGVETGGSNVQFAVDPATGRVVIIEMNPRVSRSVALASKATGFPIAKIAAMLAVGYTLDELRNDITQQTVAAFEPSHRLCGGQDSALGLREVPRRGSRAGAADEVGGRGDGDRAHLQGGAAEGRAQPGDRPRRPGAARARRAGRSRGYDAGHDAARPAAHAQPRPPLRRLRSAARGWSDADDRQPRHTATTPGSWRRLARSPTFEQWHSLRWTRRTLRQAKRLGFGDAQTGAHRCAATRPGRPAVDCRTTCARLRARRWASLPTYHQVDTCAAEFEAYTPYLYSSYESESEAPPTDRRKVMILGGGPNRIGQGIEFDYCCCHACFALQELGYETIMVNCNPETVSTDYDTSDRLYFEPLTLEDVLNICRARAAGGRRSWARSSSSAGRRR